MSNGGAPDGHLFAVDAGQGVVWLYEAPTAYLGNQLAALGGNLSFDLKTSTLDSPMQSWGDVKFIGGGIELVIDAGASPGLDWTNYSVTLAPGAWRVGSLNGALATAADFQTVFSNVESMRIRGEFSAAIDQGGLDNVVLASAVPEPASVLMMLAGLAGVGALARRRQA
jgi:Laminin B (Domain IV)/PEP-CTERM motif